MAQSLAAWNSDSLRKLMNSTMSHRHPSFHKAMVLQSAQCKQPKNCSRKLMRIRKIPIWQFWSFKVLQFLAWVFHQHSYWWGVGPEVSFLLKARCLHQWHTTQRKFRVHWQHTRQQTQKEYFDRSSKAFKPLEPGDTIRMRQGNTWEPAVLVGESKAGEPRSYIVRANDHEYRRNRKGILKTQEKLHSELADSADSNRPAEDTRITLGVSFR